MNKKSKNFPLPLSTEVEKSSSSKRNAQSFGTISEKPKIDINVASISPIAKKRMPHSLPVIDPRQASISRSAKSMAERLALNGIADQIVLNAIEQIPRHLFVEQLVREQV